MKLEYEEFCQCIRLLQEAYTPEQTEKLLRETDVSAMVKQALEERLAMGDCEDDDVETT